MRLWILSFALVALVSAKPELYKEKEDFQYSRSSSDEGSKSGFYNAQRGNMGGNYEKAHNMDNVAQKQMSSAVRQVEDGVGDTSNIKSGNLFTSGRTQGIYGDGLYDLSNLQGRNFEENYDAHNSAANSGFSSYNAQNHNARYTSGVKSGYSGADYGVGYGNYGTAYGNYGRSGALTNADGGEYDEYHASKSHYESKSQRRVVGGAPVKIIMKPQSVYHVPVGAEVYSSGRHSAAYMDENHINSNSEVLTNAGVSDVHRPESSNYESSYRYRKEWEKHDSKPLPAPLAVPTVKPYPINSELHEDIADSERRHDSHYSGYDASSSSHSRYQNSYDSNLHTKTDGSNFHRNSGHSANLNNIDSDTYASAPKKYEHSYSYHKSWERQGDPYVIVPGQESYDASAAQRLTENHGAYNAHSYGAQNTHSSYTQSQTEEECECEDESHVRVTRSYNSRHAPQDDTQQLAQTEWSNLENLNQQSQNDWQDQRLQQHGSSAYTDQHSGWNNREHGNRRPYLDQQAQNNWNSKPTTSGKLETFDDYNQQSNGHFGDATQQSQSHWDDQQVQPHGGHRQHTTQHGYGNLETLPQRPHKQSSTGNLETFDIYSQQHRQGEHSQQSQSHLDRNQGTRGPNGDDKMVELLQQSHKPSYGSVQQAYSGWNSENLRQHGRSDNLSQEAQTSWGNLEDFSQNTEDVNRHHLQNEQENYGSQRAQSRYNVNNDRYNSHTEDDKQQSFNSWDKHSSQAESQSTQSQSNGNWNSYSDQTSVSGNSGIWRPMQTENQGAVTDNQFQSNNQFREENNHMQTGNQMLDVTNKENEKPQWRPLFTNHRTNENNSEDTFTQQTQTNGFSNTWDVNRGNEGDLRESRNFPQQHGYQYDRVSDSQVQTAQDTWGKIDQLEQNSENQQRNFYYSRNWNDASNHSTNHSQSTYQSSMSKEHGHNSFDSKISSTTEKILLASTVNKNRGDIEGTENKEISLSSVTDKKAFKTPEEIETLSLTKKDESKKVDESLGVLSLEDQKLKEQRNLNSNGEIAQATYRTQTTAKPANIDLALPTTGKESDKLDQQVQTSWKDIDRNKEHQDNRDYSYQFNENQQVHDIQQQSQGTWEYGDAVHNDKKKEDVQTVAHEYSDNTQQVQAAPVNENIEHVPETTTPKPGFWKSVKTKVSSWFKNS